MSIPPDPYKILGVPKDAQVPDIRTAYRKLVLKCHPDKIQDPALKEAKQVEFQQVQQAYELLTNEAERDRYDRNADIYERQREWQRAKASAAKAPPPTPKQDYFYDVKDASPRTNTFSKSSPYGRTPPRSYEDTTTRGFEETARHARKTASYEKERPSKKDEDRRRRREEEEKARDREAREARKARERKEEKDRYARDREERERERRKEEKKKAHSDREKERGKERKSAAAEKQRSRQTTIIVEDSDSSTSSEDDVIYEPPPRTERKKSSSGRGPEDVEPLSTSDRTRKYSGNMESALRYLARSGAKEPVASFSRSKTYTEGSTMFATPMVPTPPPATKLFSPPAPVPPQVDEPEEMSDDDGMARRSSARPTTRRMSHDTPRSSREKTSSHKKSSSSRDHQPIIVEAGSPPVRPVPSIPRAHTENFARPIPIGLNRAETWYPSTERERERHERSRSRPSPQMFTDDEDSENDRDHRHRRSRRTKSPEPMPSQIRYAVDGTKSIPIRPKQYHDQPPRGSYKSKGATYITPNSSARIQRAHTSYTRDYFDEDRPQHFTGVKYSQQFKEADIRYSDLPYKGSSYRSDVYA